MKIALMVGHEIRQVVDAEDIAAIVDTDEVPAFDITDVTPTPQEGWTTSDGGKTFTAPPEPAWAPPIRTAPGPTLIKALTDEQWDAVKGRDQACIAGRDSLAENLPMIARAAAKAGIKPKDWFDAALKP